MMNKFATCRLVQRVKARRAEVWGGGGTHIYLLNPKNKIYKKVEKM